MIFFALLKSPLLPLPSLPSLFQLGLLAALVLSTASPGAQAQSFCASDGQPPPVRLMERFINADCEACWSDPATPAPGLRAVALDWIVPGTRAEEAPLSAVATRDALARLDALKKSIPATMASTDRPVKGLPGTTLRVAHGLPVSGYLGASIELKPIAPAARQQLTAWLALVETLPAGTEGSPVERNLVRNLLSHPWDGRKPLSKDARNRFFEARSMGIPPAASLERLRVIGWLEGEQGQVLAAVESRCAAP